MNYCEHCKMLTTDTVCPDCGKKALRAAQNDDFCLLLCCDSMFGEMLEEALLDEEIPCAKIPDGTGVRSALGLSLENFRIFVPYSLYEKAKEVYLSLCSDPQEEQEELRTSLLENREDWFVNGSSAEKKMKKKLGIPQEDDLFAFCEEIVKTAKQIVDQGWLSSCPAGGHQLAVTSEAFKLFFNSETFELMDVKKR